MIYNGKSVDGYAEWIQSTADIPSKDYSQLIKTWNPEDFELPYNNDKTLRKFLPVEFGIYRF